MAEAVRKTFPAGCRASDPQGGFVLWVELPEEVDVMSLHDRAINEGIGFMPGPMFSASGKFASHLRLNCSNDWSESIGATVSRLGALVEESRG
jgi:DNA-binding transcriptional MocR family regulator